MRQDNLRVLFYAEVDLNLIDGSSIWARSVLRVCAEDFAIWIDLVPKVPIRRGFVSDELARYPRARILSADSDKSIKKTIATSKGQLKGEPAARFLESLDRKHPYDAIFIRGEATARACLRYPRLAAKLLVYTTSADLEKLQGLTTDDELPLLICQTDALRDAVLEQTKELGSDRVFVLPPMIPNLPAERSEFRKQNDRVCYVGKFDRYYLIEETISAIERARERLSSIELYVAGDKFHLATRPGDKPIPDFRERVERRLKNTPGVTWLGGLSHEKTARAIADASLGTSWRHPVYLENLELSTKILEYARLGKPVLMSPNVVQRQLFGDDYELFVSDNEQYVEKLLLVLESPAAYRRAANRVFDVARQFTYSEARPRLREMLEAAAATRSAPRQNQPRRVLLTGHDFKFLKPWIRKLEERSDVDLHIDQWKGHTGHDQKRSRQLSEWADVIFCEWALGNAAYFSHRKRPHQRLVVRLHRQESKLDRFLDGIQWDAVDAVVFICEHIRDEVVARLGLPDTKVHMIYNMVDVDSFDRPKSEKAHCTLGMVGICPALKDPIVALDILQEVRARDSRFRLAIKGKQPQEYSWLWKRPDERAYYEAFHRRLDLPELTDRVDFSGWGDDVPSWFAQVGFVLSTSEFEGSHQAVAEGMASGAIPIMRNWKGVDKLYPPRFIYDSPEDAIRLIFEALDSGLPRLRREMVQFARERFHLDRTLHQLVRITFGS